MPYYNDYPYYNYGNNYYYPPPGGLSPPPTRPRASSHGRMGDPTVNVYTTGNDRGRAYDRLADEIARLKLDAERSRSRHDHHAMSHYHRSPSPTMAELRRDLERKERELHEERDRANAKDHEKDIIQRWENEQAEKKRKEKEREKALKEKIEADALLEKEKEEKAYKEFELLQAKKKLEEKEKKEKKEKEIEEANREMLRRLGYSENQIERSIAVDKKKRDGGSFNNNTTNIIQYPTPPPPAVYPPQPHPGEIIVSRPGGVIYPRARTHDISVDVLDKFGIGWRYDAVDPSYIIIYREMDQHTFEALHQETKRLRKGSKGTVLKIEGKKKHSSGLDGLRIVRHRSKSRSRSHSHGRDPEVIVVNR
ncbi:hypothetical protein K461DRAFT_265508 [Myriangium duriaei CBS 260.36]|uniref:Uncharacterized protein n=1 Tax=Myriangium duriaei CBS 260.36 TaxID=1168546 RepID=A0A9P4J9S1_9PEZI|nr:hypothetical protein K461DRAFT_265508 [Myriangium duriaei CBS 260.36]